MPYQSKRLWLTAKVQPSHIHTMDGGLTGALIDGGATIVAAAIAAGIVFIQIGRQARDAIEQSRHSEGLKLKLEIYREITRICAAQEDASTSFNTKVRLLATQAAAVLELGDDAKMPPPNTNWQELLALADEVHRASVAVITLIEQWQIVDPHLDLFKLAMVAGLHDVREAWWPFVMGAAPALPPANVNNGTWRPANEQAQIVRDSGNAVLGYAETVQSWVSDFQVEMQSLLLGELFGRKALPREPLDPRMFAVRLDRYDELKRYFENETAWGRHAKAVNANVAAAVQQREQQ
jgi:hypothetical protein